MELEGQPLLARVVERAQRIEGVDRVMVATTTGAGDESIVDLCRRMGWTCYRGSEHDVLDRYVQAARIARAEHIIRITADCPLISVSEAGRLLVHHHELRADYSHNITVWGSGLPLGTGIEVFTRQTLETSWREGLEPHHREHVDEYVYEHPERFRIGFVTASSRLHRPDYRLTVDTLDDLVLVREIYRRLGANNDGGMIRLVDVIALLDAEPELLEINGHVAQKRY
jgi:spore coat polysaccharide biosynthesis protein SpsF (cytidylyltransferase family)